MYLMGVLPLVSDLYTWSLAVSSISSGAVCNYCFMYARSWLRVCVGISGTQVLRSLLGAFLAASRTASAASVWSLVGFGLFGYMVFRSALAFELRSVNDVRMLVMEAGCTRFCSIAICRMTSANGHC